MSRTRRAPSETDKKTKKQVNMIQRKGLKGGWVGGWGVRGRLSEGPRLAWPAVAAPGR